MGDAANPTSASPEELRKYLPYLDGTSLSDSQRISLLQTIWSIMSVFVGLAFGTDPTQQVLPSATASDRNLDEHRPQNKKCDDC